MAVSMIGPKFYAWDSDTGKPLAFGKVYTYAAGTNTPKPTWQSEDGAVANTNPVILNGAGYADIYLRGRYKIVVKDADDVEVWTADPVSDASSLLQSWIEETAATQVAPNQFKVTGNKTDVFRYGRSVKLDDQVIVYGTVLKSEYLSGETFVTIDAVDSLTSQLSRAWASLVDLESLLPVLKDEAGTTLVNAVTESLATFQPRMELRFAEFLASSGYEFVGSYQAGVEVTEYNQVVRDISGEFWRVSGSVTLPYTTTGAGLPEGGAFVAVGDAVLRQELSNPDMGAERVWNRMPYAGASPYPIRDYLTVFSPKFFGAAGDGITNDHDAFVKMTAAVNAAGGGRILIDRPHVVFKQTINESPTTSQPYYQNHGHAIGLEDCDGVIVEFIGEGQLITAPGMHYGSFDPLTGERYDPPPGNFTNAAYRAEIGSALMFTRCNNVVVLNPKLHGSMDSIVIGGRWNDSGIQVNHTGIYCGYSQGVTIINPAVEDFGLDGLYVTHSPEKRVDVTTLGGYFKRNGRQGFSWTGGGGVRVYGTLFTETSRGPIKSPPHAGIDLEDNGQGLFDGEFHGVVVTDNNGPDFLTLPGIRDIKWFGGYIGGAPSAHALYLSNSGGIEFHGAKVSGSIVNLGDAKFNSCTFTDLYRDGITTHDGIAIEVNSPAKFINCDFEFYSSASIRFWLNGNPTLLGGRIRLLQTDPPKRWRVGNLASCRLEDVTIEQDYRWNTANPAEYTSGEFTFVESNGPEIRGLTRLIGDQLAIGGRTGSRNIMLASVKQNTFTDAMALPLTGTGPYSIELPIGSYILHVAATSAFPAGALRTLCATFAVSSEAGSASYNHSAAMLNSRLGGLGAGGNIEVLQVGERMQLVVTPGTASLDGGAFSLVFRNLDLGAVDVN